MSLKRILLSITPFEDIHAHSFRERVKTRQHFWKRLITATVLAAYFYVLMEWIFIITMPSFMSIMNLPVKLEIYVQSGLAVSLVCIGVLIVFFVVDLIALALGISKLSQYLGIIIPTVILTSLALLLIDNFTYTIFKFGIVSTTGIWRAVYLIIFLLLFGIIYFQMLKLLGTKALETLDDRSVNRYFYATLIMLGISSCLTLARLDFKHIGNSSSTVVTQSTVNRPHIILLGSDGLNASYFSVYGYYRDTTPTLRELAKSSLLAENAFANSGNSTGSIISILTSKLPTQTRVLYPPDILTGLNSYQHLPGILKSMGYNTAEIGVEYYIDANNYNLLNGFDWVNGHSSSQDKIVVSGQMLGYGNAAYFISKLTNRINERIFHIFYIRKMPDPFKLVTRPTKDIVDQAKIDQLLDLLDKSQNPLFIHVHLLGTHGGYFYPQDQVYSKGEAQVGEWLSDFYADTILSFDGYVKQVIDHLKATGQFENTILIIYTDHNQQWKVNERIPLMIHFPEDQYAGKIQNVVQNMDIAPTILDYLSQPIPNWMNGISLIKDHLNENRLIFSMGTAEVEQNEDHVYVLDMDRDTPPFYQFNYIDVINCQNWYSFDLTNHTWNNGTISGYKVPCSQQEYLSFEQIRQATYQRLVEDGFDIFGLP